MRKKGLWYLLICIILAACVFAATSNNRVAVPPVVASVKETEALPATIVAVTATEAVAPTKVATATDVPTSTPTPAFNQARDRVRQIMADYGDVDEHYLSDEYWSRLSDQVAQYGAAKRVLTLEYHGDWYSMYEGSYSMDPPQFQKQIRYLLDNDYHFVTSHELVGFLEGWLDLPTRSVILSTDSGGVSADSFQRIGELFPELEAQYGVRPHMVSFIWTWNMTPEETVVCKNDSCWEMFRVARDSGFFTFGSHSQSHDDLGAMELQKALADLALSREKILENTGLTVYSVSWPFESCVDNPSALVEEGWKFGLGGNSRPMDYAYTYAEDPKATCLPRLLPPNAGSGVSGRPNGMNFQQMLEKASQDLPLK